MLGVSLETGMGEEFDCPLCLCCSLPYSKVPCSYSWVGIYKDVLLDLLVVNACFTQGLTKGCAWGSDKCSILHLLPLLCDLLRALASILRL